MSIYDKMAIATTIVMALVMYFGGKRVVARSKAEAEERRRKREEQERQNSQPKR